MSAVATLSVEGDAGAVRLRLDVPERDLGEPLQREYRQPLDAASLAALVGAADDLLRGPERADLVHEARARGGVLYRTLVPPGLRDELRALRGALVVRTALPGVPWELLHDGDEFWGVRYALGRRLVLERAVRAALRTPERPRPRALVLGADPRGDLPFVAHEVELVCEALEPVADVDALAGRLATFDAVVEALGRGYDIVHWCGHVLGDEGEPALLLADDARLPGTVIEATLAGRPLVVLNGCASARAAQARRSPHAADATLSSAAHAFLLGGALAVVGTLADIGDRAAGALAEAFYARAAAGAPIGEALREARRTLQASADGARSPAWLAVVLYGNPLTTVRSTPSAPAAAPAPPPKVADEPTVTLPAPAPAAAVSQVVASPPARRRRRLGFAAALAMVLAVALGGVLRRYAAAPATPVVVGVMAVRARGAGVPGWMRELTRDALNTVLSRVPAVRVFSRQKIDFLRERRDLSEIEAAEALGMSKMLSASVALADGEVTLDLEVVDVGTGMLSAWERVQGPEAQLIALQTELALRALDAVGVRPSEADLKAIVASRSSETLDAYRLLADTLGEPPAAAPAAPGGGGPETRGPPRAGRAPTAPAARDGSGAPGSGNRPGAPAAPAPGDEPGAPATGAVPTLPTPGPSPATGGPGAGSSWLDLDAPAWAQPPDPEERAIRELLARYAAALETKNADRLATLQLEMSPGQRASLERYFSIAKDLRVHITDVDVLVDGDEAVAGFTREDVFVDAPSGRTMRLAVRVSGLLTKQPDGWRIRRLREPQ